MPCSGCCMASIRTVWCWPNRTLLRLDVGDGEDRLHQMRIHHAEADGGVADQASGLHVARGDPAGERGAQIGVAERELGLIDDGAGVRDGGLRGGDGGLRGFVAALGLIVLRLHRLAESKRVLARVYSISASRKVSLGLRQLGFGLRDLGLRLLDALLVIDASDQGEFGSFGHSVAHLDVARAAVGAAEFDDVVDQAGRFEGEVDRSSMGEMVAE